MKEEQMKDTGMFRDILLGSRPTGGRFLLNREKV